MSEHQDPIAEIWAALAAAPMRPDRLWLALVFGVGAVVGWTGGLGLLTPFYAGLVAALGQAVIWALLALARAKTHRR